MIDEFIQVLERLQQEVKTMKQAGTSKELVFLTIEHYLKKHTSNYKKKRKKQQKCLQRYLKSDIDDFVY